MTAGWSKRQFLVLSISISSESLEIRPTLLHSDMWSFVGFPLTRKYVTLNDRESPCHFRLNSVLLSAHTETVTFENSCVKTNKDRPRCQRQKKCSTESLVSRNIMFVQIFPGFSGEEATDDSGWSKRRFLQCFRLLYLRKLHE